ncbi:3-dehydroquinate synthase [Candidatus Roizmanbacteria bacterium]|nr:3-dehydroquinate synthase [Candidatus Roizmanbacteria bacterium]
MDKLMIKSRIRDFSVEFVDDFSFVDELLDIKNYVVIVGQTVYQYYKDVIFCRFPKDRVIILKLDEQRKTLATVTEIYKKLLPLTAKKNLTIISFGGGINQDVSGFVASTLYRGINWIYIPTTLLAMADSAIGLKTSLNHESYKNVLGTFYPPANIYICADFLKTLQKTDYLSGVGEIIKFMLMKKNPIKNLDDSIKKIEKLKLNKDRKFIIDIIKESIEIKKSYMEGDEFDLGKRNLLNYGHELGHALEATSNFVVPHGIAVIIGIIFANLVSVQRGWIDEKLNEKISRLLLLPNIKTVKLKSEYFDYKVLLEKIKKDKKRISDRLPLVLPERNLNLVKITDLDFVEFKKALQKLIRIII